LTRSTLVRILTDSGRLGDAFANPQRFLDQVAAILKHFETIDVPFAVVVTADEV
jgi:hypothetical protein